MNQTNIVIYDRDMQKVAYLENAYDIRYEMPLNALWNASFSLPAEDEKNAECKTFYFVELFDGNERIELFRIVQSTTTRGIDGTKTTYHCEHVLATLLDDVMFQYHTVGNLGYYTRNVIAYILSKQTTQRWQVGTVSFNRQFEYNWENDNLLAALFSVPKPFDGEYMWTFDTTSYPWSINLIEPASGVQAYIRYAVNMKGITRQEDHTELCTRLYCLGYGEGVNQLSIAEANNGIPYIDSDTQSQYGIVNKMFIDRRFQYPETLMARGQAILNEMKHPKITYEVEAAELYAITQDPIDKFVTGATVRVIDEDLGIDINARVINVSKNNVLGAPGDVTLEIANKTQDVSTSLADMADRQRISETYSQGATNIDTHDFSDNCDPTHPAKLRFWVPEEAVRINKVMLSYRSAPFRAYSKAIAGGGSYTSSVTSASGGSYTNTITSAGGGSNVVTSGDGGVDVTWAYPTTQEAGDPPHSHTFARVSGHKHNVSLPTHVHGVTINIPDHKHDVNIQIPNHIHAIEFGIYEGAAAQTVTVKVDGNEISELGVEEDSVDILSYLSVDGSGKVERGAWHEIEITPDRLSRIECAVVVQLFIQSRGGVDA